MGKHEPEPLRRKALLDRPACRAYYLDFYRTISDYCNFKIRGDYMKIEKTKSFETNNNMKVSVIEAGNVVTVRTMTKEVLPHIQKISCNEFIQLSTGEVKKINHQIKRLDNTASLKETFNYLRALINSNINEKNIKCCRFVTLTYKENMKNAEQLMHDLKNYHSRFNYYCNKKGIGSPEYIAVIEPQQRGAWHAHIIYIFKKIPPFIPKAELEKIWKHGFVDIKVIDNNCDNVGAYLCSYVSDIAIDELEDIRLLDKAHSNDLKSIETVDSNGNKVSKSYIKGLRLHLYPKGIRIFRHSRGIKLPIKYSCSYGEIMEKLKGSEKTFEKTIALIDDNTGETVNKIKYEHFNKIRKKGT